MGKILYVKSFDAVGDGTTDDGIAIRTAVDELRNAGVGSRLIFEKDKTYYCKNLGSEDRKALFFFDGDRGLTLQGENTLIKLGGYDLFYASLENTKEITIEGFSFDYAEYKPGFYGKVESVDVENGTAIITADRDIHLEAGEIYTSPRTFYCCVDCPDARHHIYVKKYEMLDPAARRFKVYFNMDDARSARRVADDYVVRHGLVMMMPRTGFRIERGFSIHHSADFTMRNVNIYAAGCHVFSLQYNDGLFSFDNVNNIRAPYDQDLHFVSWGDMHFLQNRAKYVWTNSRFECMFDDVFNISVSTLVPKEVYAPNEANLLFKETGGAFAPILKGDKVSILKIETGQRVYTEIDEVIRQEGPVNHVRFKDNIDWLEPDDKIAVHIMDLCCHPETIFENCNLDGTFRLRANVTMKDCRLYVRRFWIGYETFWEGPVGKDVRFENCRFEYDNDEEVFWHSSAGNSTTGDAHAENIVFENCTGISLDKFEMHPKDEIIIR